MKNINQIMFVYEGQKDIHHFDIHPLLYMWQNNMDIIKFNLISGSSLKTTYQNCKVNSSQLLMGLMIKNLVTLELNGKTLPWICMNNSENVSVKVHRFI